MDNKIDLTYFEIAAALAEQEGDFYRLPQDIPKVTETIDYAGFIYEYTLGEERLFDLRLRFETIKEKNIFFMLFCAAAEDEDFPFAF